MTEIAIRPLAPDEIETLASLARDIWHAHYPGIISREQIDFMLNQRYAPSHIAQTLTCQCWDIAWLEDEMAGFAHSFAEDANSWKLDKLYVHPRRQRQGIGHALLEKAKRHAKEASATRLILRVNKRNTTALGAYAKYGFRIYGEQVLDIGKGYFMDDYLLELQLGS